MPRPLCCIAEFTSCAVHPSIHPSILQASVRRVDEPDQDAGSGHRARQVHLRLDLPRRARRRHAHRRALQPRRQGLRRHPRLPLRHQADESGGAQSHAARRWITCVVAALLAGRPPPSWSWATDRWPLSLAVTVNESNQSTKRRDTSTQLMYTLRCAIYPTCYFCPRH